MWRSRELAIAVAVGLLVTVFVIWRDSHRAGITYTIGAAPLGPMVPLEITGVPRRSFDLPRLPVNEPGQVRVHVATYLQRPSATVRFDILDGKGRRQASCTFPPTAYHDNSELDCGVRSLALARRVVVAHRGPAKLAVIGSGHVVGYLVFRNPTGVFGRMRTAVDRVGISLPPGVGPTVLIAGVWLSTSAAVLALLLAIGIAREGADPLLEQGEPLGKPAGLLAEPRDDEREVQHDGEEEPESDDEQGVRRGGDPEGVGDAGEQGGPGGKDEQGQAGRQPEH
ncbi:MAG: hypothetical protein QOH00_2462 [Gaiellales bacterium]|nr:hypothetical protein [Gaiellales bacterium]